MDETGRMGTRNARLPAAIIAGFHAAMG